ncbi:hypothetical protein FHL15_006680 [Xylaria flabelliformis]|uniref:Uncharacterized protein n=1 Tax=Xylaria flabelliformis TaxID=2512241 RepID=A0A553HX38_9PEZI|nr:hypothetical protein FHL15_006680 [Xylaria flabelliformis]
MEDLRDAQKTVSEFAKWIENLQPGSTASHTGKRPELLNTRNDSDGSHKSTKTSISSLWRPKNLKKEWDETMEGILWNELEQLQTAVAKKFKVDQTALKEYISSPEMMDLGSEFVRHCYEKLAKDKAYWVAEDLFFNLQTVKHGDKDAELWAGAKVYKKEWDLADHLVRFVLLSDQFRACSGQEKWSVWEWSFPMMVGFYLSVLRCYMAREAKKRQLTGCPAGSQPLPDGKRSPGRNLSSPTTRDEKKGEAEQGHGATSAA